MNFEKTVMYELGIEFYRVESRCGKVMKDFKLESDADGYLAEMEEHNAERYADRMTEVY